MRETIGLNIHLFECCTPCQPSYTREITELHPYRYYTKKEYNERGIYSWIDYKIMEEEAERTISDHKFTPPTRSIGRDSPDAEVEARTPSSRSRTLSTPRKGELEWDPSMGTAWAPPKTTFSYSFNY